MLHAFCIQEKTGENMCNNVMESSGKWVSAEGFGHRHAS